MEQFNNHDWNHFHDVVLMATGKAMWQKELKEIYAKLSDSTKLLAEDWGMNDTVFRDNAFDEIKKMSK